jgi:DNA-directed RNA polymerase specialized sigma24 family protein
LVGGEGWVGERSPAAVTHLQLDDRAAETRVDEQRDDVVHAVDQGLLDELEYEGRLSDDERDDAAAAAAATSLIRRGEDQKLYDELAARGFTGTKYEMFRGELVAYALPVLRSWLRRGLIFIYSAKRGRPVTCIELDRMHLAENIDERMGLAGEIAANALNLFHKYALVEGQWSVEGGATLKTYFIGACLNAFPNVFRKWRTDRESWRKAMGYGADEQEVGGQPLYPSIGADHAEAVVSQEFVLAALRAMPEKVEEIASRVVFSEESHAEIAEALGTTERAVEGRLHRYRKEAARRQDERRQR